LFNGREILELYAQLEPVVCDDAYVRRCKHYSLLLSKNPNMKTSLKRTDKKLYHNKKKGKTTTY
jgi:hypothetical protein